MNKEHKVGIFGLGILFLLQLLYYFIFMRHHFLNYQFSYNPISIITMIFVTVYFIIYVPRYEKKLKYIIRNLFISIPLLLLIYIFIILFSNILDYIVVLSILIGEAELVIPSNLLLILLTWKYNLVGLNIMMFFMMVIYWIINSRNYHYSRKFKKTFFIGIIILVLIYIVYLFLDPQLLNILIYIVSTFFTLWLIMPIIYALCQEFDLYLAGVITAIAFSYFMWKFLFWYYQIDIVSSINNIIEVI